MLPEQCCCEMQKNYTYAHLAILIRMCRDCHVKAGGITGRRSLSHGRFKSAVPFELAFAIIGRLTQAECR